MNKRTILSRSLASVLTLYNTATAQTYSLQSFEGTVKEIKFSCKPGSETLTIVCGRDTLLIDYWATDYVKVLDNRFLQIVYSIRAGSNEGVENMLLLCVDSNRLYQALHVRCFSEYDMRNVSHIKGNPNEYQLFKLKAQLLGNSKSTYKLKVNIHDESTSESDPKTNHNYNKQMILNFDPVRNRFFGTPDNDAYLKL